MESKYEWYLSRFLSERIGFLVVVVVFFDETARLAPSNVLNRLALIGMYLPALLTSWQHMLRE